VLFRSLFFSSHVCNDICRSLALTEFDLSQTEEQRNDRVVNDPQYTAGTVSKKSEISLVDYLREQQLLFKSQNSIGSDEFNVNSNEFGEIDESEGYESASPTPLSPTNLRLHNMTNAITISANTQNDRLHTLKSMSSYCGSPMEESFNMLKMRGLNFPRPSCVSFERAEIDRMQANAREESILGQIHLELCKYHEIGRFLSSENEPVDDQSAFFHLQQAANLGILEALLNISKMYLGIARDILPNYIIAESNHNVNIAFDFIRRAAEMGDKGSILYTARTYDSGTGLRSTESINWTTAVQWYNRFLASSGSDECKGASDDLGYSDACDEPAYLVIARIAEIYSEGGNGVEKNAQEAYDLYNEAAEKATACGKGRLANKYFMLAEQVGAELD